MHVWLNRVLIISALLIVTAVNPYIIHHPVSQLARPNCAVNFTCVAIAFPPPTYSWTTPLENINDSTIFWEYEDVKPEHIGSYTCTAISNGMMARSNTVHLSGKICSSYYDIIQCWGLRAPLAPSIVNPPLSSYYICIYYTNSFNVHNYVDMQ